MKSDCATSLPDPAWLVGTAASLLLATIALAAAYAWFVPLGVDGGWYSYPGYALSQGRDPAENLLPFHELEAIPNSVRAHFGYELRSVLLVPIHAAWFSLFGATVASIKIFGAVQWAVLSLLVATAAWTVTRNRHVAWLAALVTSSDSWIVSQSFADLRPDIPIAIVLGGSVVALLRWLVTERPAWLGVAVLGAGMLPLLHLTGLIALSFLCALTTTLLVMSPPNTERRRGLWAIPACGLLMFLVRQVVIDFLVPTNLPVALELPFRNDLIVEINRIVAMGVGGKLAFEWQRWSDYLFISNVSHLCFVGLGLLGLARAALDRDEVRPHLPRALLAALVLAALVAIVFDTTVPRGHLISLACMAYLAACLGLHTLLRRRTSLAVFRALVIIGVAGAGLRTAKTFDIVLSGLEAGASNRQLGVFLQGLLHPDSDHTVIAPTYLWPYLDHGGSLVLVDPGSRLWTSSDDRWRHIHRVIVDRELSQRGWGEFADAMAQCNAFQKESSFGSADVSSLFLQSYVVKNMPCAPGLGAAASESRPPEG